MSIALCALIMIGLPRFGVREPVSSIAFNEQIR